MLSEMNIMALITEALLNFLVLISLMGVFVIDVALFALVVALFDFGSDLRIKNTKSTISKSNHVISSGMNLTELKIDKISVTAYK